MNIIKLEQKLLPNILNTYSNHSKTIKQKYDSFVLLDFEATCLEKGYLVPQEIIEFPAVLVNRNLSNKWSVIDTYHRFVKPQFHPLLSIFCTKLTGITQDLVEEGDGKFPSKDLVSTLTEFDQWLNLHHLSSLPKIDKTEKLTSKGIFVTCGDWDLGKILPQQLSYLKQYSNIDFYLDDFYKDWINLKVSFWEFTRVWPKSGLNQMVQMLGLPFYGKHHRGIDDCINMFNIVKFMGSRGFIFDKTSNK